MIKASWHKQVNWDVVSEIVALLVGIGAVVWALIYA